MDDTRPTGDYTFKANVKITRSAIDYMLEDAVFQSSRYWLSDSTKTDEPDDTGMYSYIVVYEDPDDPDKRVAKTITEDMIVKGLEWLGNSPYHWHFENVINDNWDAVTSDVLLQSILFQELIYG